jgi:hypothetical protein
MYNYLRSLRPQELSLFIFNAKILKKYNRLEKSKKYEDAFSRIFRDTPYPFSWTFYYDREEIRNKLCQEELDKLLVNEKRVLFQNSLRKLV